jgi:hypothetical protein
MTLKVVDFQPKEEIKVLTPEEKAFLVSTVEEILERIKNDEIVGVICATMYSDEDTGAMRGGLQTFALYGRIQSIALRMLSELE